MVSLLCRGVGVFVRTLAGLSSTKQATRCNCLPSALAAVQCTTVRWFSKNKSLDDFQDGSSSKEPPKRPLTSFFRFIRERLPQYTLKHPEASRFKVMKTFGIEWRGLPEAEKRVYTEAAKIDFLKYSEHYKKYRESLNSLDLKKLEDARSQKLERRRAQIIKRERILHGRPKGCCNSLNIFFSERLHEIKCDSQSEKLKILHREWKNLSSSQKQVYVQLAEDDRVRYQNEMKAWKEQMIEIGRQDLIKIPHKPRDPKKKLAGVGEEPGKRVRSKSSKPAKGRRISPGKHEE